MMQKIIEEVAKAYKDYEGLDEIKRGILLAMAVTDNLNWTEQDYHRIIDGVVYKIEEMRRV